MREIVLLGFVALATYGCVMLAKEAEVGQFSPIGVRIAQGLLVAVYLAGIYYL